MFDRSLRYLLILMLDNWWVISFIVKYGIIYSYVGEIERNDLCM